MRRRQVTAWSIFGTTTAELKADEDRATFFLDRKHVQRSLAMYLATAPGEVEPLQKLSYK